MFEAVALIAVLAISAAAGFFAWAWWRLARRLKDLAQQCSHLEMLLAAAKRSLMQASTHGREKDIEIVALNESLARSGMQMEQLRDMIKVHVARRREFEEWANPIRALLGEGIAKMVQELKDRLARQEFAMRRQDQVVAEAQDQYRGKRDELERLRQELTLKNYHIAALNERFIRIEERMRDLSTEIYARPEPADAGGPPTAGAGLTPSAPRARSDSPETERFTLEAEAGKDWMSVLDDWQRQLQTRFERLDELQAKLRGGGSRPDADAPSEHGREDPAGNRETGGRS
jgi:hypothetical protein